MIKAILFDYGGTIDTDGVHWGELFWRFYQKHGVPVTQEAFRDAYVFGEKALAIHPLVQPGDTFRDVLSIKIEQQFLFLAEKGFLSTRSSVQDMQAALVADSDLYAKETVSKATAVLQVLASKWPLVLVSNFYGNIQAVLEAYGIRHFFSAIVESAVVGVRKPNPEIFALGVKAAEAGSGECLVVGDSYRKDILPAKSVGCQTVWLQGKGWEADPGQSDAADYIIHRFAELSSLLLPEESLLATQ